VLPFELNDDWNLISRTIFSIHQAGKSHEATLDGRIEKIGAVLANKENI